MSKKWAVDIAEAIGGARGSEPIAPTEPTPGNFLATVISASPLSISISGAIISKNLYIDPRLMLEAQPGKLESIFANTDPVPPQLAAFLKSYHDAAIIHDGDTVTVKQFGIAYCVTAKVVPA